MDYFVPIYVSAKNGLRTDKILDLAMRVLDNTNRRVSTGQLNDLILDCVRASEPPSVNGKRLKIA
jgi:GTP-binding protein